MDYPGTRRGRTVAVAGAVPLRAPLPPSCESSSGEPHIAGRPVPPWIPRRLPFKKRAIHMGSLICICNLMVTASGLVVQIDAFFGACFLHYDNDINFINQLSIF